jgi:hypothetical protein
VIVHGEPIAPDPRGDVEARARALGDVLETLAARAKELGEA